MADNAAQATQAAELPAAEGDDGFTAEERAQFAEMEKVTSDPSPELPPTPEPAPVVDAASAADDTADDDDDGEEAAASAEGAAAAKPAGEAGAAPAAGEKPKKRVSFGKYKRTEEALLAAEKRASDAEKNQARLDERLRILNEALTAPPEKAKTAEEEDPEPDAEKDIFAWVEWNKRDKARIREEMNEIKSGRQAETQDTQLANTYVDDARTFAASEPNFVPAYQFLMANRTFELAQYYFGKDLTEEGAQLTTDEIGKIKMTIAAEEKQLASEAIKNKQSPAKRIFALAKARGYRPAAAADTAATAQNGGAAPTNGAAKPAVAAPGALGSPAAAAPRVEDEIARIKAGSEAARSLSSGGGAPPNPLTPEKLANMPQDEFDALVETLSPSQTRELFGT